MTLCYKCHIVLQVLFTFGLAVQTGSVACLRFPPLPLSLSSSWVRSLLGFSEATPLRAFLDGSPAPPFHAYKASPRVTQTENLMEMTFRLRPSVAVVFSFIQIVRFYEMLGFRFEFFHLIL